jgi:hypothetical protein
MIVFICLFGVVGFFLLVGGGELAKAPPGAGRPLPRAYGWWLRFVGGAILVVAVVRLVQDIVS